MNARTEDMVERYLEAVAAQLSVEERDDIVAELRDLILSRIEAREEALGRALNDDEREAILKEIGHPLVVAARYRKGPDSLIGPELFPYWLYGVKAGLLILLAIAGIGLFIRLITGSENFGRDISQAFHGFFGSGLTLIGALTLAGAIMEHYAIRPKWLTEWRARDLSAFGLSDPTTWGVAAKTAGARMQAGGTQGQSFTNRLTERTPATEAAFGVLFVGIFVLWWVGLVSFPGFHAIRIDGELVTVSPAPIWTTLFVPILLYALGQMGIDLFTLIRPSAERMRAALSVLIGLAGLALNWAIFDAGHWFTLSVGAEQARIAGDWALLDFDRMRTLGDGGRDLLGVASSLSVVMTWALALTSISMIYKTGVSLVRTLRP